MITNRDLAAHAWADRMLAPLAEPTPSYWALPSVECTRCHTVFSLPVGRMHEQRTGHEVLTATVGRAA